MTRTRTVSFCRLTLLSVLLLGSIAAGAQTLTTLPDAPPAPGPAVAAPPPITPDLAPAPPVETPDAPPVDNFWLKYGVRRGLFLLLVVSIIAGMWLAHRGKVLPTRDIPGLLAMEEAVARATEMGRPTLFTVGGGTSLQLVQLYASMPVLREVSRMSGELSNRLMVPVCFPETMPVHTNAIRDGYSDAFALESFRPDDVRFFPGGLFFFAMGAMGWMLEERPAACFYFGYWVADSLMFSETGQTIEAMQIAGTDQLPQVPFFVVSCDYTMIGEEFWAASAKLSGDPELAGSLGAQDIFKLVVLLVILAGSAAYALPGSQFSQGMTWLRETLH